MRVFLRAHRSGFHLVRIKQAGFLHNLATGFDLIDLASCLKLDRQHHEADRIDILGFGPCAEFLAGLAHADIHVGAHRAFFHISVARADIAQDRTQLLDVCPGLGGRAHIRFGDNLHQRDATAVQIDIRHGRVLIVHQLACILLDMDALNADLLARCVGVFLIKADINFAFADNRVVKLRNLVALRQIGIKVILAIKARPFVDLGVDRHAGAHGLPHALAVEHRQHAGHGRVDQRNLTIGLCAKGGGGARKQFGVRGDLGVNLKSDDDFPFSGGALNTV